MNGEPLTGRYRLRGPTNLSDGSVRLGENSASLCAVQFCRGLTSSNQLPTTKRAAQVFLERRALGATLRAAKMSSRSLEDVASRRKSCEDFASRERERERAGKVMGNVIPLKRLNSDDPRVTEDNGGNLHGALPPMIALPERRQKV